MFPLVFFFFFLQEYTKFLKLISMTTSCKYYVVILCLQFCGIGTGDVKAFNCARNSGNRNERDCE